jgi:phosphopantothenoylcysteine decarboxylase / phosphopantothenate---cysteine ligase
MKKILLCITGSIAAYKSADLASQLVSKGYDVHVIMTRNSTKFITPMVYETLTKNRVYIELFQDDEYTHLTHISSAQEADLILVAPATYNILGKMASGIADDLLSSILAAAAPNKVIMAPAMNVNMYNNQVLTENIKTLQKLGVSIIEPDEGMLACGDIGKGRMRNLPSILEYVDAFFCEKLLLGKNILITAGATREYLDPIRFISNSSSGLMGLSLAKACRNMGAKVKLILANNQLNTETINTEINIINVSSVQEMYEAATTNYNNADLVFAAAAVSDYKPKNYSQQKIKKADDTLMVEMERNTDILYELGKNKTHQKLIGFAAESENLLENALKKLERKNLDMIIANGLSNFGSKSGGVTIISKDNITNIPEQDKETLAYEIVKAVVKE